MNAFLLATSSSTVNDIVSLGITIAILNAVVAIVIQFGRVLYSSGRDRAWPGPVNAWMSSVATWVRPCSSARAFEPRIRNCTARGPAPQLN